MGSLVFIVSGLIKLIEAQLDCPIGIKRCQGEMGCADDRIIREGIYERRQIAEIEGIKGWGDWERSEIDIL